MKKIFLISIILSQFVFSQYRILSPLYLKKSNADTITGRFVVSGITTGRTYTFKNADGTVLLDLDTTLFRTFSDLKYLKNADSTTQRNYSNALYAPKQSTIDSLLAHNNYMHANRDSIHRLTDSVYQHNLRINALQQRMSDSLLLYGKLAGNQSWGGHNTFTALTTLDSAEVEHIKPVSSSAGFHIHNFADQEVATFGVGGATSTNIAFLGNASFNNKTISSAIWNGDDITIGYIDTTTIMTKLTDQVITAGSKYITPRWYFSSVASDTIDDKSGNGLTITANSFIAGSLSIGDIVVASGSYSMAQGYADSSIGEMSFSSGFRNTVSGDYSQSFGGSSKVMSRYSFSHGQSDSILATHSYGHNYSLGRNNIIGRTNPTGTYGNWLLGSFLRSENLGVWALGADDAFENKNIPFEGSIVFVNEQVKHWGSNPLSALFSYMPLSYAIQSPHVKDTLMYAFRYQKYGSASDDTGYAALHYELHRGFIKTTTGGETQKITSEGSRVKRIYSINQNNDDAWHFNTYNGSGRPFGNIYVDSAHFIVSAGYADADSFRLNGSTFLNSTALSLGSKTVTTTGAGSFGALSGTTITASDSIKAVKSNNASLILRTNGASSTYTWLDIGRRWRDGLLAVTGTAGLFFTNSTSGSLILRSDSNDVFLGSGTGGYGIKIAKTSNNVTIANDLTVSGDSINTATTVNFAPQATTLSIGAGTGTTTVNNLTSLDKNGGTATIPAGGIAKVYISGLTTSGKVTLAINKSSFVTLAVADTLPSWNIPSTDTLYIRYKYNEVVGYGVIKK